MSAASRILDRADRPKQTRPGSHLFGCPLCQSRRGRPVSLRELDDGRVLLYSFCGHETADVLAALGLTMADLFDEKPIAHQFPASHSKIPARDLLEVLDHEILVAVLILEEVVQKRRVGEGQVSRLIQAAARIGKARDMANPAKVDRHAA